MQDWKIFPTAKNLWLITFTILNLYCLYIYIYKKKAPQIEFYVATLTLAVYIILKLMNVQSQHHVRVKLPNSNVDICTYLLSLCRILLWQLTCFVFGFKLS